MNDKGMTRRQFLRRSGGAVAGAAALSTGAATLVAPKQSWAAELSTLDAHQAQTLVQATRHIFPHSTLAEAYYVKFVEGLDAEAAKDASTAELLKNGVAELDSATGIKWLDLSVGAQREVLFKMVDTPFFGKIRGGAIVGLYNQPLVWRHFGYEGPAFQQGGYINRGFDDLNWLPDPPEDASPKAS